MDQSRSKRQVLILDCCNSGAFAQGTKAVQAVAMGTAIRISKGLWTYHVLTASDSTQFAWEGDKSLAKQIIRYLHIFLSKAWKAKQITMAMEELPFQDFAIGSRRTAVLLSTCNY